MNKDFWMLKECVGHVSDGGDAAFSNPSKTEPKRSHNWFIDAAEPQLFPNKKQALQGSNSGASHGIVKSRLPWEEDTSSSFQSVPNQFIERLFGSDIAGRKDSIATEESETSFSYSGMKKVEVNHVNDSHNAVFAGNDHGLSRENDFISRSCDKEYETIKLMGHTYNKLDAVVRPAYSKGDEIPLTMSNTNCKEIANMISFDMFHEENGVVATERPVGSYATAYNQSSDQAESASPVAKQKPVSVPRSKSEAKSSRKEALNCFPSNVKTLISTGMLDGVPVKYVSLSREELRGIIRGSGYLCGCQLCNYSKVLNAYEFERHANCKTKHPNNHIYFDNGKTIYQIVQELKNTPQSFLFDAIQTVFGAPINQKSFRAWKESYQAATRELQRIYGKDDLSLL